MVKESRAALEGAAREQGGAKRRSIKEPKLTPSLRLELPGKRYTDPTLVRSNEIGRASLTALTIYKQCF